MHVSKGKTTNTWSSEKWNFHLGVLPSFWVTIFYWLVIFFFFWPWWGGGSQEGKDCVSPPLFFFCFLLSSRILNVFSGSEFSLNIPFAWGFSPFPHPTLSPGQCFGDHLPHCCALYSRCLSHLRILSNISTLRVDLLGLIGLNSFFSFLCNFSEMLLFCKMLQEERERPCSGNWNL